MIRTTLPTLGLITALLPLLTACDKPFSPPSPPKTHPVLTTPVSSTAAGDAAFRRGTFEKSKPQQW